MTETLLGTLALGGLITTAIGCWFYMWGGRSGKFKRRFIGSLICASAIWLTSLFLGVFSPLQLLAYPILILAFSLGYGASIPLKKAIKRTIVVLCSLLVGVLLAYTIGGKAWLILPLQGVIAAGSIWLGVKNPIHAAPEEFFVCLLLTECNIIYPFVANL